MIRILGRLYYICNTNSLRINRHGLACFAQFHSFTKSTPQTSFLYNGTDKQLNALKECIRRKSKNRKNVQEYDESSDEEDGDESETFSEEGKIRKLKVTSFRADSVIKKCFGVRSRTLEELFPSGKVKVNGKPVVKKAYEVKINDVIEVFIDSDHTSLGTIVIKSMKPVSELIHITVVISKK